MNPIVRNILLALFVLGIVSGMVYKATHPADYQHPLAR